MWPHAYQTVLAVHACITQRGSGPVPQDRGHCCACSACNKSRYASVSVDRPFLVGENLEHQRHFYGEVFHG